MLCAILCHIGPWNNKSCHVTLASASSAYCHSVYIWYWRTDAYSANGCQESPCWRRWDTGGYCPGPIFKTIYYNSRSDIGKLRRLPRCMPSVRESPRLRPVNSPDNRPVTWSFGVFFVFNPNKLPNKQLCYRWFETPWHSCNGCDTRHMWRIIWYRVIG